ncbi:50S ribosomal protein L5 [Candidatus Micrarchaeota archaeon]|nr:50S ribosomal protein L5 [Candidatus Micrarchaeota archaeon]MBU1165941.1 50S ribosomal protein L5 [Candidatus Micrarchaeota archaeon]MBU1886845.1 50S ribosomal protein L5 [Candidatus Micrarchaeota archaeon]
MNKMQEILLDKVTVNIGVGQPGDDLESAKGLLSRLANGNTPVETHARRRQPVFKLRQGMAIGTKVTLRGDSAKTFLDKALAAKRKVLKSSNFDKQGNVSFGIHEYIDFPGIKYDPSIPMFGFDVCISLTRPGKRVSIRKLRSARIGKRHRITKDEAIEFVKNIFDVKIE